MKTSYSSSVLDVGFECLLLVLIPGQTMCDELVLGMNGSLSLSLSLELSTKISTRGFLTTSSTDILSSRTVCRTFLITRILLGVLYLIPSGVARLMT